MTIARILGVQNSKPCASGISGGAKVPLLETSNSARVSLLPYSAWWISNLGAHLLVRVRMETQWACLKHPRHCGTENSKLVSRQSRSAKPLRDGVLLLLESILYITIVLEEFYRFTQGQVHKWYLRVLQSVLFACVLSHTHPYAHSEAHSQAPTPHLQTLTRPQLQHHSKVWLCLPAASRCSSKIPHNLDSLSKKWPQWDFFVEENIKIKWLEWSGNFWYLFYRFD